jgi:polysaccharide biosynthesis/export protein
MTNIYSKIHLVLIIVFVASSCATKKDLLYLQDMHEGQTKSIEIKDPTLQPNDILMITVSSTITEAAEPYNNTNGNQGGQINPQGLQLTGYLVSSRHTIDFPVLGEISTKGKNTHELADTIETMLKDGGHLKDAQVAIRLTNAKFTILGEINSPGTYTFTEQNITLLQALGLAGDLSITGLRDDIRIYREYNGTLKVAHINLKDSNFIESEFYYIKPNDVIIVNPSDPKVKSAGYIRDPMALLSLGSVILSVILLATR